MDLSKVNISKNYHILKIIEMGVEIYEVILKRSMVISADVFAVDLRYFYSSRGNLTINAL